MLKKCKCGYLYETTWQDIKKSWYVYDRNKINKNKNKTGNNTCKAQTKTVVDSN